MRFSWLRVGIGIIIILLLYTLSNDNKDKEELIMWIGYPIIDPANAEYMSLIDSIDWSSDYRIGFCGDNIIVWRRMKKVK